VALRIGDPRFQRGQRTQELVSVPVDQEIGIRSATPPNWVSTA